MRVEVALAVVLIGACGSSHVVTASGGDSDTRSCTDGCTGGDGAGVEGGEPIPEVGIDVFVDPAEGAAGSPAE